MAVVRRRHRLVAGRSHRGEPYDASDPALSAWVHNSLADSFLTAYRTYGAQPCPPDDADRYVREQTRVGALLSAEPLPVTAAALTEWVVGHPDLAPSPGAREAVGFLRRPPLPTAIRVAYGWLFRAAVATLPARIRDIVGVTARPGDLQAGRLAVAALRWSLGSSPDWQLALARTRSQPPPGIRFRQPLPAAPPRGLIPARNYVANEAGLAGLAARVLGAILGTVLVTTVEAIAVAIVTFCAGTLFRQVQTIVATLAADGWDRIGSS